MKKHLLVICLALSSCTDLKIPLEKSEYLDYAASWKVNEAALIEFANVSRLLGNSSGINQHAKHLKELESRAAKVVAAKIGVEAEQIHFTAGASAANNIAILGVAYKNPGCHLITSKIEHKSVLNVFKHLEKLGYKVTYLNVDQYGRIDLEELQRAIAPDTKLISIQTFNSEIGVLQDISRIAEIAHQHGVLFHADAAQSFCKYDIDMKNIDMLTISGYKIGAPKGIGAVYVRDVSPIQPIMFGSGDKLCPGTRPTALICAFAKAIEKFKFNKKKIEENYKILVHEFSKISDVHLNSSTPSHVVSVSIGGVLLKDVLERMQKYSFSAGCSCVGSGKSNVMAAIDPEDNLPPCTIRISFSDETRKQSLIDFVTNLKKTVESLRKEKSVSKGCESDHDSDDNHEKLLENLKKVEQFLKKK